MWYFAAVLPIAAVHAALWFKLFGEAFTAGELGTPQPGWSHWYSPRVIALWILSVPGMLPGFYVLFTPLRLVLRNEDRAMIALAIINGLIWGFGCASMLRVLR